MATKHMQLETELRSSSLAAEVVAAAVARGCGRYGIQPGLQTLERSLARLERSVETKELPALEKTLVPKQQLEQEQLLGSHFGRCWHS